MSLVPVSHVCLLLWYPCIPLCRRPELACYLLRAVGCDGTHVQTTNTKVVPLFSSPLWGRRPAHKPQSYCRILASRPHQIIRLTGWSSLIRITCRLKSYCISAPRHLTLTLFVINIRVPRNPSWYLPVYLVILRSRLYSTHLTNARVESWQFRLPPFLVTRRIARRMLHNPRNNLKRVLQIAKT